MVQTKVTEVVTKTVDITGLTPAEYLVIINSLLDTFESGSDQIWDVRLQGMAYGLCNRIRENITLADLSGE